MTMDDYSKIYIKPSKNTFKKKERKEQDAKRGGQRKQRLEGEQRKRKGQAEPSVKIRVTTYNHAIPCAWCALPWWASVSDTAMGNIICSSMLSGRKWLGAMAKFSVKGNGCIVPASAMMSDPA